MKINVTRSSMPTIEEYCDEIKELWETHWLTNTGVKYKRLQDELTKYLGVDNLSLYTNGHLALEAALALFSFPRGSEVITTPFTFVSTTNAIVRNGLIPRFCDINEKDYTLDVGKIEGLINERTVAILPVHVYGHVCDVNEIERIAAKHNLKVIYDAAHAFGVKYNGAGIGRYGDVSMFSFHATKVFNTIEGGCICFKDSSFEQTVEDMKNFGIRDEEHCLYIGGNAKMNEFQASMGICNLRHIDDCIIRRKAAVEQYRKRLGNIKGIHLVSDQKNVVHNYSYMPVVFDGYKYTRDEIKLLLANHDIGARKYFYPLTSEYECYKDFDKGNTPVAKYISERVLTLPLFSDITIEQVDEICDIILGKI